MNATTLPDQCAQVNGAQCIHQSTRKVLSHFFSQAWEETYFHLCAAKTSVSSPLWGQAYWLENIFDRSNYEIKRSQVDALFLSMYASGLLTMERDRASMRWKIAWTDSETPAYMDDARWMGMPLLPPTRAQIHVRRIVPTGVMEEMQRSMHNWLGGSNISNDKGD